MLKNTLSIFIITLLISSCHQNQSEVTSFGFADKNGVRMTEVADDVLQEEIVKTETQKTDKKKIIKDGRLGLQVTDLDKSKSRIDVLTKKYGAYYANENLNNTDWESSFDLKIRIPSVNFENIISEIETGDSEVLYKEIYARDVTDQFIDLETRLENKRNYLKRYNDLLNQAKNIKEILEIEEKIRGLEEEIESTAGRLKYLNDLVDYSTLDLNISKKKEFKYNPINRDSFTERLKQSLSKGWYGFVDFLLFAIKLWPFWIIVIFALYLWRKYKKKKLLNK